MNSQALQGAERSTCDVSIIIVSFNTCDVTCSCVQSIYDHTDECTFEIIVVDNGSLDGSAERIAHDFPKVRLVTNADNRGFAAANNQGMKLARGNYVLLLNSDTVLLTGTLQRCLKYADSSKDIGVIGCKALFPDGRWQCTYFRFPNLLSVLMHATGVSRVLERNRSSYFRYWGKVFQDERAVDVVAACFFLVRREVIESIGMFDEDFFMYGEEAEWCSRIARDGWRIVYFPHASIIHIHGGSADQVEGKLALAKRRGEILFMHKARGPFYAWCTNAIMTCGLVLRVPVWGVRIGWSALRQESIRSLVRTNFEILSFHLKGLLRPVWR